MWFNGVRTGFPVTLTAGELIRLKDIPASAEGILAGGSRLHDGMDGEATGEVETRGDGETTKVFTTRSDEDLRCKIKKGDEMIVEIGNFKRDITLPAVLANQDAKLARFVDKALEIHFMAPVNETEKSA